MARSGPRDPGQPGRWSRVTPRWSGDARGPADARDGGGRSAGRGGDTPPPPSYRSPRRGRGSQQWDASADGPAHGGWDASQEWPAQNDWTAPGDGGYGAVPRANGSDQASRDTGSVPKSWRRRLGLTREQWRLASLRAWPGVLRLMAATLLAGGLIGAGFYGARAQPMGGTQFGQGGVLLGPSHGPAPTATISLYGPNGPHLYVPPPPTNTPTPPPTATTGATATPSGPIFVASPVSSTGDCASPTTLPVVVSFSNTSVTQTVQWQVTVPSGWAGAAPSQGTLAARGNGQTTITPSASVCAASAARAYSALLMWSASGGASGTITITETITPAASPTPPATAVPTTSPGS